MRTKLKKLYYLIFIVIVFIAFPLLVQNLDLMGASLIKGKIVDITAESQNQELEEVFGTGQLSQSVSVKLLDGSGEVLEITNYLSGHPAYDIDIKKGDIVTLESEKLNTEEGETVEFYISDKYRFSTLILLLGIFFLTVLLVGKIKGIRSLIGLFITAFLMFFLLVPAIKNYLPIIPVTVGICALATFITMFIVGGYNKKSLSASFGTVVTLIIAAFLSIVTIKIGSLTGFGSTEAILLYSKESSYDFKGILAAAMIVSALGAIMDIGMSISSCIYEIKATDNTLTAKQLVKSGMNVGKDIIGTMTNTLILVYIGSSLPLILLASNSPITKLLNLNSIAGEIAAALVGSIGIVLCVPITAVITAYLITTEE